MKKTIITILAVSAGIFAISACQKNLSDVQTSQVITKTVTVSDTPWTADTKTAFTEADGIKVTGDEKMTVAYCKYTEGETLSGLTLVGKNTEGIAPADGKWSFTHNAIDGATAYNYVFVLPYANQITDVNAAKTSLRLELPYIQYPSENSFDSGCDFLLGQPQYNVSQKTEISDIKFKRLFAPLKVEISDSKNVLGDEKIRTVTFATDIAADENALVGRVCFATFSSDYAKTQVGGWSENPGNALTAFYGTGHTARNAWFIVSPRSVSKDTKVTLIVTTDSKTITRTATLTSDQAIKGETINVIPFDISGDGYTVATTEFFDFNNITKADDIKSITGSNGTASPWTHANGSTIVEPMCFRLKYNSSSKKNASLSLTSTKKVTKIRFYSQPRQPYQTGDVKLNDADGTVISTIYSVPAANGGYIDIDIPAELQGSTIKLTANTNISVFSGATLFYGE